MNQVAAAYKILQDAHARGESPAWADCLAQASQTVPQAAAEAQSVPAVDPRIQHIEQELQEIEHPTQ